jgi:hypothetical protein
MGAMVYAAVAAGLAEYPGAVAMALNIEEAATVIGPVYEADELVGVVPSVV